MDPAELKIKVMMESLKFSWSDMKLQTRKRANTLFEWCGLDIFPNSVPPFERESIVQHSKFPSCEKYKLPNDTYFHNYVANPSMLYNLEEDLYLSIGSCSFFPVLQTDKFDCYRYNNYLAKIFETDTKTGLLFAPEKPSNSSPFSINKNGYIKATWDHNLKTTAEETNTDLVWGSFENFTGTIKPQHFRTRYLQAKSVENLEDTYSVLTFGQFQEIYGFFMKMVQKKQWQKNKFNGYVANAVYECRHSGSRKNLKTCYVDIDEHQERIKHFSDCDKVMDILVDTLHHVKPRGTHAKECYMQNKLFGYNVFRSLALKHSTSGQDHVMENIKKDYWDCYNDTILELGVAPSSKQLGNWKKQFKMM